MKTSRVLAIVVAVLIISVILQRCAPATGNTTADVVPTALPHPLNPLDTLEISLTRQLLLDEKKIDNTYRFYLINLLEPPKAWMQTWERGQEFPRVAFACVYDSLSNRTFEAKVDLKQRKVISFENIPGVTSGAFGMDWAVDRFLNKDPQWLEGLKRRGIHPDSVKPSPVFAGELGIAPADHRELIVMPEYKNSKNSYITIDGLVAYVDVTAGKVLKVLDDGGKGFYKPVDLNYFDATKGETLLPEKKRLGVVQPDGQNFSVEGFEVTGPQWAMHIGMHNREGLVIHQARYNDRGNWRSVVYRASVAEMFVPYGSTNLGHVAWNYYDAGAYRMGQNRPWMMNKLKHGADVPDNAVFLPGYFHDEHGKPTKIDSAIAVYEEYGGPKTRHGTFALESRNLVIKYYTTIANYDYAFKWIFQEDGQIDFETELTGIVGIKAVNRVTDAPGKEDDSYNGAYFGTLVAPHVEAVNHQHFFSFRIDLDVDGMENLVEEMNTNALPRGPANPWNNAFVMQMSLIRNEKEGMRNLNAASNRHWMIANANATNSLGQQKSYVLMPGHNASPLALPGSGPRKMADFLENQVWATAYNEDEIYPAGEYPNSRGIVDGLPSWVSDNQGLVKKDVVLWYNMGITHIVRPEDWPVMNIHTMGFSLKPFGFFDSNPVADNGGAKKVVVATNMPPDVTMCVPLPK